MSKAFIGPTATLPTTIFYSRPLKSDSTPIYGDGYKPKSLKFRLRANAETSHSVRYDLVVVVGIVGGGEKFLYRMVRSRKQLLLSAPYE